ncbi:MAG: hypothetical protein KDK61_02550 [Simkania sp.]|nr:hypothetical protein [Simkania sp.]
MKKMLLMFAVFLQPFLWGEPSKEAFYMGEMKCQYLHENNPEHFGIFFLKRSGLNEDGLIIDSCLLVSPEEGIFSFQHVAVPQDDPNEFLASNPESEFIGEGEIVGFPWDWTELRECLEFDADGGVIVRVENIQLENGAIVSKARIFFKDDEDEEAKYFATFSAYLYPIDPSVIDVMLHDWGLSSDKQKERLASQ